MQIVAIKGQDNDQAHLPLGRSGIAARCSALPLLSDIGLANGLAMINLLTINILMKNDYI